MCSGCPGPKWLTTDLSPVTPLPDAPSCNTALVTPLLRFLRLCPPGRPEKAEIPTRVAPTATGNSMVTAARKLKRKKLAAVFPAVQRVEQRDSLR